MDPATDPSLQHFPINVSSFSYASQNPSAVAGPHYDPNLQPFALNLQQTAQASAGGSPRRAAQRNGIFAAQQRSPQARMQTRQPSQPNATVVMRSGHTPSKINASPRQQTPHSVFKNSSSTYPAGGVANTPQPALYLPVDSLRQSSANNSTTYFSSSPVQQHLSPATPSHQPHRPSDANNQANDSPNPLSSTFPLVPNPPLLSQWRHKLFNITTPLILSESEYLTYFPHIDNVYSHRSTQKYKRKPFVSHYWDCRLKGRPSGTKKSDDPNKKKRKRTARERDLCDVKIKVTEFFSRDECRRLGLTAGDGTEDGANMADDSSASTTAHRPGGEGVQLTIVMEDRGSETPLTAGPISGGGNAFGMLEPEKRYPQGHPGEEGKRWFKIQRVNGNASGGALDDDEAPQEQAAGGKLDLDHKHTLEESDRIKKNSVQRWLLREEKERRLGKKGKPSNVNGTGASPASSSQSSAPSYLASGQAFQTARLHKTPVASRMIFFANSFCPFAQRVWIALEIKEIPYQYVEVVPRHLSTKHAVPAELLEVNPEGIIPAFKHGNWGIWESGVMMEYLEDLAMGHNLLPLGNPQLRAHCRLWVDHINRKILPAFYSLLLAPPPTSQSGSSQAHGTETGGAAVVAGAEQHSMLITTLQTAITNLVNASHAVGPFFLGSEISYVDVTFAPWIIRLSRVLSYYRNFPRPELGTRWQRWVDAVEADEHVRRTVSDENSYHGVYRGVGDDGWDGKWTHGAKKAMVEMQYARRLLGQEGFGLGGDLWGRLNELMDRTTTGPE